MAFQAPWRIDKLGEREIALTIKHDPLMNAKGVPKHVKEYQKGFLQRNPFAARDWSTSESVIRAALAGSDEDDIRYFPQTKKPE